MNQNRRSRVRACRDGSVRKVKNPHSLFFVMAALFATAAFQGAHAEGEPEAGPAVRLSEVSGAGYVSPRFEWLVDESSTLSFEDVRRRDFPRRFSAPFPNFGPSRFPVWGRIRLHNDRDTGVTRRLVLTNARMWEIDLYLRGSGSEDWQHRRSGARIAFHEREVQAHDFVFILHFEPGETKTIYARFRNRTTLQIPLRLLDRDGYDALRNVQRFGYGFFFGIMAALALYNLLLFAALRDRNYLYYVVLLTLMALFIGGFLGLNYQYLYPWSAEFNHLALPAVGLTAVLFVGLFTIGYLQTARLMPRVHLILQVLIGGAALAIPLDLMGWTGYATVLGTGVSLCMSVTAIYGGAYLWRGRRYNHARFYTISWGIFFAAVTVHGLIQFGVYTSALLMNHVLMFGTSLFAISLSLGMAWRIQLMDRDRLEMETQMEIAREIQQSLLPGAAPERDDLRVAYLYKPMQKVGGDFVDFHIREDNKALFTIADVTGHGVPAALLASMIKMALPACYNVMEDPSRAVRKLHERMRPRLSGHHITVCFCYLDLSTGLVRHASAGHLPVLRVNAKGELHVMEKPAILLHPLIEPQSENQEVQLEPGDTLLMYTDGLTETVSPTGEEFGEERLRKLATELGFLPPADLCSELHEYVSLFSGDVDATQDDFTLLAWQYLGNARD